MKELHNHIFSSTTCLSKKTMLKYMNKQLSKNELHDVEKHLLDCEFCSDAFEGIKLAQNSSMLFAIDNKIDQRVRSIEKNNPLMRNLMVAASVLIIVFGAYLTFNNTFHPQQEYSILEEEHQVSRAEPLVPKDIIIEDSSEKEMLKTTSKQDKESIVQAPKISVIQDNEESIIEEDVEGIFFEEEIVADESPVVMDEIQKSYPEAKIEETVQSEMASLADVPKSEMKEEGVSRSKSKKESARKLVKKNYNGKTYIMHTHKIYDYTEEYQQEYDFKKAAQPKATAPDFANEEEKKRADNALEKTTIEISYKEVLELGVEHLKNKEYQQAIEKFNIILETHPKDINALFYCGICFYNTKQYPEAKALFNQTINNKNELFNEEAEWYKALTAIQLDQKEAKQLLQVIIDGNGFYKNQAIEKLKTLK